VALTKKKLSVQFFIKQVRRCNRKLFRGQRSHIKNTGERFIKGFQRFDKVIFKGIECFIFGRRTSGYFDLRKIDGAKVHSSVNYKQISLLERAKPFLIERRMRLLPSLTEGVSVAKN